MNQKDVSSMASNTNHAEAGRREEIGKFIDVFRRMNVPSLRVQKTNKVKHGASGTKYSLEKHPYKVPNMGWSETECITWEVPGHTQRINIEFGSRGHELWFYVDDNFQGMLAEEHISSKELENALIEIAGNVRKDLETSTDMGESKNAEVHSGVMHRFSKQIKKLFQ